MASGQLRFLGIPDALLRLGINARGRLDANRVWDVGLRAAIVADLILSGVISGDGDSDLLYVDTDPTGVGYLDLAVGQLLGGAAMTTDAWISRGQLRSVDVVGGVLTSDGWGVRLCLTCSSLRMYTAPAGSYEMLAERVRRAVDDPAVETSQLWRSVAVLALALRLVEPTGDDAPSLLEGLPPDVAHALTIATNDIRHRSTAAMGSAGAGG